MPQYGAGVSFSKMKRSMDKRERKKKTKSNTKKDSREKYKHTHKHTHKQTHKKVDRSKVHRSKRVSSSKNSCQCGTHNYTGLEPTPRGLGNCEECIPLHVVLRGKDGQLYENRGNMWSLL